MQQDSQNYISTDTATEKLYDLCFIETFCRGKQEQVKRMIDVFVTQMPDAVAQMKAAYAVKDYTTLKNTAHRIKPTLSYFAVVKIEKEILQIEKMAGGRLEENELPLKIEKIDSVINEIIEQMKSAF